MSQLQNIDTGIYYCSVVSLCETKCPTCESLPEKYGVINHEAHLLDQRNKIFQRSIRY